MKIEVDRERCMGHARCHALAPQLFELDDDGYVDVEDVDVPPGAETDARNGEAACPERAITILGG